MNVRGNPEAGLASANALDREAARNNGTLCFQVIKVNAYFSRRLEESLRIGPLRKSGASRLAPSPRLTVDAPGPTLWARCEATEVGGVYICRQSCIARFWRERANRIHASLFACVNVILGPLIMKRSSVSNL